MRVIRIENKFDTWVRDTKNYCNGFKSGFVVGVVTLGAGLIYKKKKDEAKEYDKKEK